MKGMLFEFECFIFNASSLKSISFILHPSAFINHSALLLHLMYAV